VGSAEAEEEEGEEGEGERRCGGIEGEWEVAGDGDQAGTEVENEVGDLRVSTWVGEQRLWGEVQGRRRGECIGIFLEEMNMKKAVFHPRCHLEWQYRQC
jgi:hypothetical protein